jgi:hypothetical protein
MPPEVFLGLQRLNPKFWTDEVDREYRQEIENPPFEPIEKMWARAYECGQVQALIYFFLTIGMIPAEEDPAVRDKFTLTSVQFAWDMYRDLERAPEDYDKFVKTLRKQKMLIE